jgi:hypothetical protein
MIEYLHIVWEITKWVIENWFIISPYFKLIIDLIIKNGKADQ